ncbi:MAG TPA: hypothetical protein VK327_17915 [Candidatus Paceibacterota bacterium]|nr:hypothetical protein [Candidatus Paceibacterota bacterium]
MTKKTLFLIIAVLALAGLSFYLNRDRFRSPTIQIGERWMEPRGAMARRAKAPSKVLMFLFDRRVQLSSVKVVHVSDAQTNRFPHPIWELVSDSNSVPVKEVIYGQPIRGMKPSVKGATADPLQPGVAYRLFIQAGSQKAEHDFSGPATAP